MAAATAVLDPDLVVLSSSVGHGVDLLLRPVRETLRTLTPLRPKIVPSRLGEDTVCWARWRRPSGTARDVVFRATLGVLSGALAVGD